MSEIAPVPPINADHVAAQPLPPTPGWKTSEFWTTLLLHAVNVLALCNVIPVDNAWVQGTALVCSAVAQAVYTAGRSSVKNAVQASSALLLAAILLGALGLGGCSATASTAGASITVGDVLDAAAGTAIIVGDQAVVSRIGTELNTSFTQGKITADEYDLGYSELSSASEALVGLGDSVASGQSVSQAQIAAAFTTFVAPLQSFETSYLGGATGALPPNLTHTTGPVATQP